MFTENLGMPNLSAKEIWFDAIYNRYLETVKRLVGLDSANISAVDARGRTALIYALHYCPLDMVEFLLANGARC